MYYPNKIYLLKKRRVRKKGDKPRNILHTVTTQKKKIEIMKENKNSKQLDKHIYIYIYIYINESVTECTVCGNQERATRETKYIQPGPEKERCMQK